MLLANMAPPSYRVDIPAEQSQLYRFAAPLFIPFALASFGLWFARYRGIRVASARALLLASAGSLCVSYSSLWLWLNREDGFQKRNTASIVAVEMPFFWLQACLVAFLFTRDYLQKIERKEAAAKHLVYKVSPWKNEILAVLLAVATVGSISVAGDHALMLPLMWACWFLAFVVWGIIGVVIGTFSGFGQAQGEVNE